MITGAQCSARLSADTAPSSSGAATENRKVRSNARVSRGVPCDGDCAAPGEPAPEPALAPVFKPAFSPFTLKNR
ncbi:hypothetical protein D3C71_1272010 [compost metagenome]